MASKISTTTETRPPFAVIDPPTSDSFGIFIDQEGTTPTTRSPFRAWVQGGALLGAPWTARRSSTAWRRLRREGGPGFCACRRGFAGAARPPPPPGVLDIHPPHGRLRRGGCTATRCAASIGLPS